MNEFLPLQTDFLQMILGFCFFVKQVSIKYNNLSIFCKTLLFSLDKIFNFAL